MARHPLQRLTAPSRTGSLCLHLLGATSFAFSFRFLMQWETFINDSYGWHFQFLTIIGLTTASVAFGFGILSDLTLNETFFHAKNTVAVVATPLEVVISILYWGLRAIDPNLVVPGEFEMSTVADVGFHLAPAVFLTLDLVFFSPPWTIPVYAVMSLSTGLAFGYWNWVEHCFSHNGWYPYPIFELLSTPQRALLFTFSAALVTVSSSGLKWLYGFVNGYDAARKEAHKPLKKVQ